MRWLWTAYLGALMLGCGLVSVRHGADASWDLRNYHLYTPFAALGERYSTDVAPAQLQSYFNPLLDYPFYCLIQAGNGWPRLTAFLMGSAHGLNLFAVTLTARACLGFAGVWGGRQGWGLLACAVLIGATGAGSVPLIGTTTGDLFAAIPVLFGVDALLGGLAAERGRGLLWAGLGAGLATGAKLTMAVYVVGMMASLLVLPWRLVPGALARFGAAALAGFGLAAGPHMARMASLFGNPVFPLFNSVFRSPFWQDAPLFDRRFLPGSVWQAAAYPVFWAVDGTRALVSEIPFRDPRLALALLAALVVLQRERALRGLALFFLASYAAWLGLFAIYRYAVPLEMLSGVAIVLALSRLGRGRVALSCAAALVCIAATEPLDWGHTAFRAHYIEVAGPALPEGALVAIAGGDPVAYLIPFMDRGTAWLGIANNLLAPGQDNALLARERALVALHEGPVFALNAGLGALEYGTALASLGLAPGQGRCAPVASNLAPDVYWICPAIRD
jgi:hypothetical protein